MNIELKGRIFKINDTERVTDTFSKRVFLLEETTGKYPNTFSIEATNAEVMNELSNYKQGDKVKVQIDIRGRVWAKDPSKAFNSLVCWRIERDDTIVEVPEIQEAKPITVEDTPNDSDGLPF